MNKFSLMIDALRATARTEDGALRDDNTIPYIYGLSAAHNLDLVWIDRIGNDDYWRLTDNGESVLEAFATK